MYKRPFTFLDYIVDFVLTYKEKREIKKLKKEVKKHGKGKK